MSDVLSAVQSGCRSSSPQRTERSLARPGLSLPSADNIHFPCYSSALATRGSRATRIPSAGGVAPGGRGAPQAARRGCCDIDRRRVPSQHKGRCAFASPQLEQRRQRARRPVAGRDRRRCILSFRKWRRGSPISSDPEASRRAWRCPHAPPSQARRAHARRGRPAPRRSRHPSGLGPVCAGTYGSPAILMRSGIGPAEHLRSVAIPVRLDLPGVGANLADHGGIDIDAGYRGPARPRPDHPPDRHLHSTAASRDQAPDLMLWLSDPRGEPPVFEIDVVLLRLRSRGTVRLRSPDPTKPPSIELPNLRDPSDAERLAEGYRRGHEVASRPELRRLCDAPPSPEIRSADELPGLIRAEGYSFPHFRGPARWARCLTKAP